MIISRIAPTPSGYLHPGNALNFLLTSWLVKERGGKLNLRIDDMDGPRTRTEYVDEIFWALDWLGIEVDEGPSGTDEFFRNFSMQHKTDYYRAELAKLTLLPNATYECDCSRKEMATGAKPAHHRQPCQDSDATSSTGGSALRLHVPTNTRINVAGAAIPLDEVLGDFVVWRKDGLPAYQLVSVIEDRDARVNFVVRGADLLPSTAAQLFMAPLVEAELFSGASFLHHELLIDESGRKLAKSNKSSSLREASASPGARTRLLAQARQLWEQTEQTHTNAGGDVPLEPMVVQPGEPFDKKPPPADC